MTEPLDHDPYCTECERLRATLAGLPEVLLEAVNLMAEVDDATSGESGFGEIRKTLSTFAQRMNQGNGK